MLNTNDSKRQEIIYVCVNVSEEGKVFCALLAKTNTETDTDTDTDSTF